MLNRKWPISLPALPGPKFRPPAVSNQRGMPYSDLTPPHAEVQTSSEKGGTAY